MKFLKALTLVSATLIVLGILGVLILLKYPYKDPTLPPQVFAPLPSLEKLPQLKISVLESGYHKVPQAFAVRDGNLKQMIRLVHSGILVQHPHATFLIDTGLGRDIDEEIHEAPRLVRLAVGAYQKETPLADQAIVRNLNKKISFILLTHGHWDHLSGALDFPGVPIRALPEEIYFLITQIHPYSHGILPSLVKTVKNRLEPIVLQPEPYENFAESLDLFQDHSVILVPLRGHTPGSLGVFLNLAPEKRFFIVGDAVWRVNANGRPEARSLLAELFSDNDRLEARETRKKLAALVAHSNEVVLVPSHDPAALAKIPQISRK